MSNGIGGMEGSSGLYHPFIHFESPSWVAGTVLYLDKMHRIVPRGYPVRDQAIVRVLADELDFVRDEHPTDDDVDSASEPLWYVLAHEPNAFPDEWRLEHRERWAPDPYTTRVAPEGSDPRLGYLHVQGKFEEDLAGFLIDRGYAELADGRRNSPFERHAPWVGMHPDLLKLYMSELARATGARTGATPITAYNDSHLIALLEPWGLSGGPSTQILLAQAAVEVASPLVRSVKDARRLVAFVRDPDNASSRAALEKHLRQLSRELIQAPDEPPEEFNERVLDYAKTNVEPAVRGLVGGLRGFGFEVASTAVAIGTAVTAGTTPLMDVPTLAVSSVGAALAVAGATAHIGRRAAAYKHSPYGYLAAARRHALGRNPFVRLARYRVPPP